MSKKDSPREETSKPSRRSFLQTSLLTAAGLTTLGATRSVRAQSDAEPGDVIPGGEPPPTHGLNVLVLMVDEQRYPTVYESAALAQFRADYLVTQEMLRQNGVEFQRHYAASTACAPSRTSLYTGHYPSLHGVTNTDGAAKSPHDPEIFWLDPHTVPTLGDYFRAAGYRTFWKGKWHISHADIEPPGTHGSLNSYDANGNRDAGKEELYLNAGRLEDYGFSGWVGPEPHGRSPLNSGAAAGSGRKGRDEAIAGQAVELIEQLDSSNSNQPWMTVVSFVNPHDIALWGLASRLGEKFGLFDFTVGGHVPADLFVPSLFAQTRNDDLDSKPGCQKSYRDAYRQFFQPTFETADYFRFYYQAHHNVDAQLGRVYAALQQSRFFDNTLVVFTSDHGDLLGAHNGMHQKWYQAYDEALRVPLVFACPGLFQQPQSHTLPTSHVDVLPTLLGLAGINAEQARQTLAETHSDARPLVGRDLTPLLRGLAGPESVEAPVYFMTDDDPSRGQDQENIIGIPYDSVVQPNHIEAVVARRDGKLWKYVRYFDNPQFWSQPGTPGTPGVKDVVVKPATFTPDVPGEQVVPFSKRVKVAPLPDEYELYDLTADPLELNNLAGDPAHASTEAAMRDLLSQQCAQKRLTPLSASVPGQPACA
jgi:choline-sulfatase